MLKAQVRRATRGDAPSWPHRARPGIHAWEEREAVQIKVRETQIQQAVIGQLRARGVPGHFAFHPANGGSRTKAEAGRFRAEGVVPGVPDVVILYEGRAYGLELKTLKGRLSDHQIAAHAAMTRAGATCAVAYGLDAAIEQLERWGLLRPDRGSRRSDTPTQTGA